MCPVRAGCIRTDPGTPGFVWVYQCAMQYARASPSVPGRSKFQLAAVKLHALSGLEFGLGCIRRGATHVRTQFCIPGFTLGVGFLPGTSESPYTYPGVLKHLQDSWVHPSTHVQTASQVCFGVLGYGRLNRTHPGHTRACTGADGQCPSSEGISLCTRVKLLGCSPCVYVAGAPARPDTIGTHIVYT
jgi:hypothetical protein